MFWIHGVGVCTCPARGGVRWGERAYDYDGVETLAVLFLPVLPLRAIHVTRGSPYADKDGSEYQEWPIRFSAGLIARAFVARWLWAALGLAVIALFFALASRQPPRRAFGFLTSGLLGGVFFGGRYLMDMTDARNRHIRLLLGRHHLGSSDPASWRPRRFEDGVRPEALYGTTTFADAVPKLLSDKEWSRAMWAARLCVALEDTPLGERLTDEVLERPEVRRVLARLEADPVQWRRVVLRNQAPRPEPVD